MSTPLAMREIIAVLTVTGTTLYTRCATRIMAAPADSYDAESPGVVVEQLGGESNPHNPVWNVRCQFHCYGGRTNGDRRIDEASKTYQVLSDRLRSIEMLPTANAVVMDAVELGIEELTVDPDRNVPVSLSTWDVQIKPLT
jgi:hypothetical protein